MSVRQEGNVIPFRRKDAARRTWPQWVAVAASLGVGIIIGQALLARGPGAGPVSSRNGVLLANGVLARALTQQPSGMTGPTPAHIAMSFKDRSGAYCRTFTFQDTAAVAGLACREDGDWHVQVLAQTAALPQQDNTLRPAATEIPKTVLEAAEAIRLGDPLDAQAEAAAREARWEPTSAASSPRPR